MSSNRVLAGRYTDVPSNNLNGAGHLEWRADTFLTTVPIRSEAEPMMLLASFS
jgi:hypothetical protein